VILLIDNYDSFTFNLFQLIERLGERCRVVRNDAITAERVRKLAPRRLVISPGPGTPDESGVSLELLGGVSHSIPTLGVCLGHQALAQVYGARVVRAPRPMHGKLSPVRHTGVGVFRGLPSPFEATRYHSLAVEPGSVSGTPLEVTAKTDGGVIMGLRHRRFPIEGVQFHPESIMTVEGEKLMLNFLRGRGR
jgi:anthranilate synthase/aminodeoxychorismate synthase-like glutamine amidotransferase